MFKYFIFIIFSIFFGLIYPSVSYSFESNNIKSEKIVTIKWKKVPHVSGYQIKIFNEEKKELVKENLKHNFFDWIKVIPGQYTYQVASISISNRLGHFSSLGKITILKNSVKIKKPSIKYKKENIVFNWEKNKHVSKYELKIRSKGTPSKILHFASTKGANIPIPINNFLEHTKFKWESRAYLKSGESILISGTAKLPSITSPIMLVSPPHRKRISKTKSHLFHWKQKSHSSSYILKIWKKRKTNKTIFKIKTKNTYYRVPHKYLKNKGKVYWNVVGIKNKRKKKSKSNIFYITNNKNIAPKLITPADGHKIIPNEKVIFSWEKKTNVKKYRLQISNKPINGKILLSKDTSSNFKKINFLKIKNKKTLYWKIITYVNSKALTSKTRKLHLIPRKHNVKKINKHNQYFKKRYTLSAFYTGSKGIFKESVNDITLKSTQDSPLTLGLATGCKFKPKSSVVGSFYISKLDGSIYRNQKVTIPMEYSVNSYYNHHFRKLPFIPFVGIDHEHFSTYNTDELPLGNDLKIREHNITYFTVGVSKLIKVWNRKILMKGSISRSLHSFSSTQSLISNKNFSGMKYIVYVNLGISKRWMIHGLYKGHFLSGPTNLEINRLGLGFGYKFF